MKRYRLNDIMKLPKNPDAPKPFPGRYPTRIAYAVLFVDQKRPPMIYVGKPSISAVQPLLKIRDETERAEIRGKKIVDTTMFCEFDRAGFISRNFNKKQYHQLRMLSYYHPWDNHGEGILCFGKPFFRKLIGGNVSYSPHKTLRLEQVRERRTWLLHHGFNKKRELQRDQK